MSRGEGLFRGSELPRLLLLAALLVVGWPLFWLVAVRRQREAPPPSPPAAPLPPTKPDDAPAFAALRDRQPMAPRDNVAYALLLDRARKTPPDVLAREARRDILFTHLWEAPARYRGVPVHLEGTARRVISYEVNPELAPGGRLYEAWTFTEDSQGFPYDLVFEDLPPGMPTGPNVQERVRFDGYFFKLLAYQAGDKPRGAPVLVGRLAWVRDPPETATNSLSWTLTPLVLFTLYVVARWGLRLRSLFAPATRRAAAGRRPRQEIEPEDLSHWLERTSEESGDEDGGGGWSD